MRRLIFCAEYIGYPFFDPSIENMGEVAPADLGLPPELFEEVEAWDAEFQKTFCDEYPPDSGFATPELLTAHNEQGRKLAGKIQSYLGDSVVIEFVPLSDEYALLAS